MSPYTNDAFACLSCAIDLPFDPLAGMSVRRNQHNHRACPPNSRSENVGFDIRFALRLVWLAAVDGAVADAVSITA